MDKLLIGGWLKLATEIFFDGTSRRTHLQFDYLVTLLDLNVLFLNYFGCLFSFSGHRFSQLFKFQICFVVISCIFIEILVVVVVRVVFTVLV